eukprot:2611508-Ditylum_brightwellii.AAC.1
MESDACGSDQLGSNMCCNDDSPAGQVERESKGRMYKRLQQQVALSILQHHRATVKLKKCKWSQSQCMLVGMDVCEGGNKPAASNNKAFCQLQRPNRWADLQMIVGVFIFYSRHLPLYNLELAPWQAILAQQLQP